MCMELKDYCGLLMEEPRDMTLCSADGKVFQVHSNVIYTNSTIINKHIVEDESTFIENIDQNTLKLSGIPSDVLQVTLDFMYGIKPQTISNFKLLQSGADKLGVLNAIQFCKSQVDELSQIYQEKSSNDHESSDSVTSKIVIAQRSHQISENIHLSNSTDFDKLTKSLFADSLHEEGESVPISESPQDPGMHSDGVITDLHGEEFALLQHPAFQDTTLPQHQNYCNQESFHVEAVTETLQETSSCLHQNVPEITVRHYGNHLATKELELSTIHNASIESSINQNLNEFHLAKANEIFHYDSIYAQQPFMKETFNQRDSVHQSNLQNRYYEHIEAGNIENYPVCNFDNGDAFQQLLQSSCALGSYSNIHTESLNGNTQKYSHGNLKDVENLATPAAKTPVHYNDVVQMLQVDNEQRDTNKLQRELSCHSNISTDSDRDVLYNYGETSSNIVAGCGRIDYGCNTTETMNTDTDGNLLGNTILSSHTISRGSPSKCNHQDTNEHTFKNSNQEEYQNKQSIDYHYPSDKSICTEIQPSTGNLKTFTDLMPINTDHVNDTHATTVNINEISDNSVVESTCSSSTISQYYNFLKSSVDAFENTLTCDSCSANTIGQSSMSSATFSMISNPLPPDNYDTHQIQATSSKRRSHQNRQNTESSKDLQKADPQVCEECGEICLTIQSLKRHQLKVHRKGQLFPCTQCSFKTPRKKDILSHLLSQHGLVPPNTKVYSCNHCTYRCVDKCRFDEHQATHSRNKTFHCEICDKFFTTKRGLRNHLLYHSDEKPFQCDKCQASFKVRSKLRDHIRLMHLQKGEKPFKCGYCDFHAAVRGNVNQHIRHVHKQQNIRVVDTKIKQRRFVKKYDYENITGNDIQSKEVF